MIGEYNINTGTTSGGRSRSNFGRVRSNLDIDVDWEIFLDFYWELAFYFNYDNKPTSNASQTDYRFETAFKYEL